MARHIHCNQPMGDELADDRTPGVAVVLPADAERGELVMAEAPDALVGLAQENRDDMRLPEALAGAVDAGQKLLGGDGAVEGLGWVETDIAIAAGFAVVAEIAQENLPTALAGFGETQQRIELAALHLLACIGSLRLVDKAAAERDVLRAVEHQGFGGQAVAARAACLLVVGLDAGRQVRMQHEAHIGLVDAHAEGDGGHHDQALLMLEAALVFFPRPHLHAGVVGQCGEAVGAEGGGDVLRLALGQTIDDAAFSSAGLEEAQYLLHRARLLGGAIADIGAVKAGDEAVLSADAQMLDDLRPRRRIRRGGERNARHVGEEVHETIEGAVFGPEIMAPLREAVGLVDGDEREARGLQPIEALGLQNRFRGHVEEVQLAPLDIAPEEILFRAPEPGIERRRLHAGLSERRHLVFHQRDEGRDDEANARTDQRRDLVAERLASARRHQDEGVVSRDHMLDDVPLPAAEGVIAINTSSGWRVGRPAWEESIMEE